MNESVKSGFLNEIFAQREDLLIDYDFRNAAANNTFVEVPFGTNQTTYLNFNLEVPTGNQYSNNKIIDTGFPALAYTDSGAPSEAVVSGHFDGNTKLNILDSHTGQDWTFYLAFKHLETGVGIDSKVLLASKTGLSCQSGFAFGINGCNRLFFEHDVSSSEKRIYTLNKELDNKNLASLSKINSNLYIGLHQFNELNSFSTEENFELSGYSHSDYLFLGGLGTSGTNYVNFSGYIDQFMMIDKGLEFPERNTFSESFFCSGYNSEVVQTTLSSTAIVTGVKYETVLAGTGVTGYSEYIKGYEEINGENVPIYSFSGITGPLYEERITELTSVSTTTSPTNILIEGSGIPNYGYIMSFANTKMLSFNNFDDSYKQVYSFSGENSDDVNLTSAFINANNKFSILATGSGEVVNLYVNGLIEPFVPSFDSNHYGEFKISGSYVNSDNFLDKDDIVTYDIIQGSMSSGQVTSAEETAGFKNVSYADVGGRDIYLNGTKLISGLDYTDIGSGYKIQSSGFSEGQLIYAPRHDKNISIYTGYNDNNFDTSTPLFDEELWINGLKQIKYLDYEKVSDFSLKYTSFSLEPITTNIYNNDTGYFNV